MNNTKLIGNSGRLKVLIGCPPIENPFIGQLFTSLSEHQSVSSIQYGKEGFWCQPQDFDLLHIHWPESLFGWKEPSISEIEAISHGLQIWKAKTRIVVTVHNRFPHNRDSVEFQKLYRVIYSLADGIIHLGKASVEEFKKFYPDFASKPSVIIPHGNYACFKNVVSREEARGKFNLEPDEVACISFGALRNMGEIELLWRGFREFNCSQKILFIVGRICWDRSRLRHRILRWRFRRQKQMKIYEGFLPEDEVQDYLNATDIVIIPRINSLNSGNVALGLTFGKVVVGPDTGVIGETLRATSNPVFDPLDSKSLAAAILRARDLLTTNLGENNRAFAINALSWNKIAQQHIVFYQKLAVNSGQI